MRFKQVFVLWTASVIASAFSQAQAQAQPPRESSAPAAVSLQAGNGGGTKGDPGGPATKPIEFPGKARALQVLDAFAKHDPGKAAALREIFGGDCLAAQVPTASPNGLRAKIHIDKKGKDCRVYYFPISRSLSESEKAKTTLHEALHYATRYDSKFVDRGDDYDSDIGGDRDDLDIDMMAQDLMDQNWNNFERLAKAWFFAVPVPQPAYAFEDNVCRVYTHSGKFRGQFYRLPGEISTRVMTAKEYNAVKQNPELLPSVRILETQSTLIEDSYRSGNRSTDSAQEHFEYEAKGGDLYVVELEARGATQPSEWFVPEYRLVGKFCGSVRLRVGFDSQIFTMYLSAKDLWNWDGFVLGEIGVRKNF